MTVAAIAALLICTASCSHQSDCPEGSPASNTEQQDHALYATREKCE